MINKRDFLKSAMVAGLATTQLPFAALAGKNTPGTQGKRKWKHWVWVNPRLTDKEVDLQRSYASYYEAGIRGIFFEASSEMHFRAAKQNQIEAHRWIWTLNRGEKSLLAAHPDWYAVNRKGESCADKPPYVGYYRWLCPTREEVSQYLETEVKNILRPDWVDGVHLDYVRYCDVILPLNLWSQYGIEQNRELPEYDYCYCPVCQERFQQQGGPDLLALKHPDQSLSWRKFRYDNITRIVNRLASQIFPRLNPTCATTFSLPDFSPKIVRQNWT